MEYGDIIKSLHIRPIRNLILHEETIDELTNKLKKVMETSNYFTNPVIVDKTTNIVLDGVHRVRALDELGYKNIVCQLVDYGSPEIKVKAWYPIIRCGNIGNLLNSVDVKKTTFASGMKDIKKAKAAFMLAFERGRKKECFLVEPSEKPIKPKELFAAQKHVLMKFSRRHAIRYIPDEFHEKFLQTPNAVVLYRKCYTKAEVVDLVKNQRVILPPKSTRHIISMRVLGVDIPMSWLNLTPKDAQEKMHIEIHKRSEAGAIRLYPEPVLVLNDYKLD